MSDRPATQPPDRATRAGEGPRYRSVACFVDTANRDVARAIVAQAARWCARGAGHRLAIVHVDSWLPPLRSRDSVWQLDRPHLMDNVRQWLGELCAGSPGADPVLLSGPDPPAQAADWAEREGIDLVVVAAHNGAVPPARMGSFAGPLAALARVPVLVIPPALLAPGAGVPSDPLTHIACCLDESRSAERALGEAVRLRDAEPPARLTLVHGVVHSRLLRLLGLSRILPPPRRPERKVVSRLAKTAQRVPRAAFAVVDGRPRDVAAWAARHGADLLVAGAGQNQTGVRFPGSFAHEVAVNAECPVLLVPPAHGSGRSSSGRSQNGPATATPDAPAKASEERS